MSRIRSILDVLAELAGKGDYLNHKHAAVVMAGGKPVAWGINKNSGIRNIHAEISAIYKYLSQCGKDRYVL